MMRNVLRSAVLGLSLLAVPVYAPPSAQADIYEYVDADGVSHYTNLPETGKRWKRVIFQARTSRAVKTPRSLRDRSPDRFSKYDSYIMEAARLYQLPEAFLRAHPQIDPGPEIEHVVGNRSLRPGFGSISKARR